MCYWISGHLVLLQPELPKISVSRASLKTQISLFSTYFPESCLEVESPGSQIILNLCIPVYFSCHSLCSNHVPAQSASNGQFSFLGAYFVTGAGYRYAQTRAVPQRRWCDLPTSALPNSSMSNATLSPGIHGLFSMV